MCTRLVAWKSESGSPIVKHLTHLSFSPNNSLKLSLYSSMETQKQLLSLADETIAFSTVMKYNFGLLHNLQNVPLDLQ